MAKTTTQLKPLTPAKRRIRPLGPFSYLLLCTIKRLAPAHCYGAELEQQLSAQYHAVIDPAQVYVALRRMAKEQMIVGKARPSPTDRNYEVVVYTITPKGEEALWDAARFYKRLAAAAPE
jgi:DNA-binding PadR family transcriptional regulator